MRDDSVIPDRRKKEFIATLPTKITGIVFWGMVLIGLLGAFGILQQKEKELLVQNRVNAKVFAYEIQDVIYESYFGKMDQVFHIYIQSRFDPLMQDLDIPAVELVLNGQPMLFGSRSQGQGAVSLEIDLHNSILDSSEKNTLIVYFPDNAKALSGIRKNILLSVGLLAVIFGVVLKYILTKVLSAPFISMVNTASEFTRGNKDVRFDDTREDEFGYLSGFINQALLSVLEQETKLKKALTKIEASELELGAEKERAEVTLQSLTDAVITTDREERIIFVNPAAEKLIGRSAELIIGEILSKVVHFVQANTDRPVTSPLGKSLASGVVSKLEKNASILSDRGEAIHAEATAAPLIQNGNIIGAVMVIQDVSQTRELTFQLTHQASHDTLTGLYNRRKFEAVLEEFVKTAREEQRNHAMCYLDLDQFKIVNDTCGHIAGDELLRQLPDVLNMAIRSNDIVARLGGDEFGVLLENCHMGQAKIIAEKIRKNIKDFRFVWQDKSFDIGVSIGVVAINEHNTDIHSIMTAADLACYAAKDMGRNRIHVYESSDSGLAQRHGEMHWAARINDALENGRFFIAAQPIAYTKTRKVAHFEVLVRLRDNDGKTIPPGSFIPSAERYGLMQGIDQFVIHESFKAVYEGKFIVDNTNRGPVCSINLSGASLNDDDMLEFIVEQSKKFGDVLNKVCFEVTETVAISNLTKATEFMEALRNYGCRFSLDDFGSGLSSFAYLKTLPVDYLKIDGAFIRDMIGDPIDRAMVESINQIGHVMSLKTIAEWVEDEPTLKMLQKIGVDYVQGYELGKPRPVYDESMAVQSKSVVQFKKS